MIYIRPNVCMSMNSDADLDIYKDSNEIQSRKACNVESYLGNLIKSHDLLGVDNNRLIQKHIS